MRRTSISRRVWCTLTRACGFRIYGKDITTIGYVYRRVFWAISMLLRGVLVVNFDRRVFWSILVLVRCFQVVNFNRRILRVLNKNIYGRILVLKRVGEIWQLMRDLRVEVMCRLVDRHNH